MISVHDLPAINATLNATSGLLLLAGYVILELKYRTALPLLFKRLVEEFKLNPEN